MWLSQFDILYKLCSKFPHCLMNIKHEDGKSVDLQRWTRGEYSSWKYFTIHMARDRCLDFSFLHCPKPVSLTPPSLFLSTPISSFSFRLGTRATRYLFATARFASEEDDLDLVVHYQHEGTTCKKEEKVQVSNYLF